MRLPVSSGWRRFRCIGAAFAIAYPKHRLAVLILVLCFAGILELIQHFTPGRHGRIRDTLVKAVGAALGTLVVLLSERAARRLSGRHPSSQDEPA